MPHGMFEITDEAKERMTRAGKAVFQALSQHSTNPFEQFIILALAMETLEQAHNIHFRGALAIRAIEDEDFPKGYAA